MKAIKGFAIALLCISLADCGWLGLRDRSNDYLLSEEVEPITIPDGMDKSNIGQIYPIPPISGQENLTYDYEVPRPQPASINNFEQVVKIQSFEDRRWVLINLAPSEVWPRVRNILSRNGIPTAIADGTSGIVETAGISFKSDQDHSHRFRFIIEPGVQLNSTEISALHQQNPVSAEDMVSWPTLSDNDNREEDMLEMLANDLASTTNYSQVSLLAQKIGGDAKVAISAGDAEEPYISIALNYDRCWASVNYSASRGGFSIVDKNRSEGLIYVNYTPELEEEAGFFKRLFGGRKKQKILESNYQILIERSNGYVKVKLRDHNGEQLVDSESLRLLGLLRSNLS